MRNRIGIQTMLAAALGGLALIIAAATPAQAGGEGQRASIPFADLGNIRDWRAYGDDILYVESVTGQWYQAEVFGPCLALPFAETIAFVTEPDGSLDKFSSIWVDGDRCFFRSFEKIAQEPSREWHNERHPD
ncbi:MAG: hypothetical protein Tsb0016_12100 [Sphingomonadales bacterium]